MNKIHFLLLLFFASASSVQRLKLSFTDTEILFPANLIHSFTKGADNFILFFCDFVKQPDCQAKNAIFLRSPSDLDHLETIPTLLFVFLPWEIDIDKSFKFNILVLPNLLEVEKNAIDANTVELTCFYLIRLQSE